VGYYRQSPLFDEFRPFSRFFDPLFWTRILKTGPPENREIRTPRNPEIREIRRKLKKGPKITPAKTTYDEKVGVLIKTPVLVQKTPPLKPVRNFGVRNLVRGIKKGPKNTPAKTGYDEKVGVFISTPVFGPKNPPAKTG